MKKYILNNVILGIFLLLLTFSCKNSCLRKTPEIINPHYSMYNFADEKGYNVSFRLSSEAEPTAIIINKIRQNITPENKQGLNYKINVISETRKIENYKITGSQLENGIIFNIKNKEIFKPVKFELN